MTLAEQITEIRIPLSILGQQNQVVLLNGHFGPEDGFDPDVLARLLELDGPLKALSISNGHSLNAQFRCSPR
jgi:hypothetical protein